MANYKERVYCIQFFKTIKKKKKRFLVISIYQYFQNTINFKGNIESIEESREILKKNGSKLQGSKKGSCDLSTAITMCDDSKAQTTRMY